MSPDEWKKNPLLLDVARELAFRPVGWTMNVALRSVGDVHPKNGPDDPRHRDYLNLALALGGHRLVDAQPTPMNLVEQMAKDQNLEILKYDFLDRGVVGLRNRTGVERGKKYEITPGREGELLVHFAHDLSKVLARKIVYVELEFFSHLRYSPLFSTAKSGGWVFCGHPVRFCAPGEGLYWLVPKPEAVDLLGIF
jgi:hypothetical protein